MRDHYGMRGHYGKGGSLWNEGSLWDEGSLCRFSQQLTAPEPFRVPWGRAVSCAAGEGRAQLQPGLCCPCSLCPSCALPAPGLCWERRGSTGAEMPWAQPRAQLCPLPSVSSQGPSLLPRFHFGAIFVPLSLCIQCCLVSVLCLGLPHIPSLFSVGVCSIPLPSCSFILYVFSFVCSFSFVIPYLLLLISTLNFFHSHSFRLISLLLFLLLCFPLIFVLSPADGFGLFVWILPAFLPKFSFWVRNQPAFLSLNFNPSV